MKRQQLLGVMLLISFLSTIHIISYAQGWEKKYSPDRVMEVNSIVQMNDQSCMMTGFCNSGNHKLRIMKIATDGSVLWAKDYDSITLEAWAIRTQDDGFLAIGYATDSNIMPNTTARSLLKVDNAGNKLWLKNIPSYSNAFNQGAVGNMTLDTTDNGGFVYTINTYDSAVVSNLPDKSIRRLNSTGDTIWSHTYYAADSTWYLSAIKNSKDGGFIVTMGGGTPANGGNRIFKIDSAGNYLWEYIAPYSASTTISAKVAHDGNILINGSYYPNGVAGGPLSYIGKLDQGGNQLWLRTYPTIGDSVGLGNLVEKNNGTFAGIGGKYTSSGPLYDFVTADSTGNVLTQRRIPLNFPEATLFPGGFLHTADGGYMMGIFPINEPNHYSSILIKMDSTGSVYPHLLSGTVFLDTNNNCVQDPGDVSLRGSLLTFAGASDTFTVATNATGFYYVGLNNGTYQMLLNPSAHYTVPSGCDPTQVTITTVDSTILLGAVPTSYGPYVNVDGYSRQRECVPIKYQAQYCNNGTAIFNGEIDITFDSLATVDSASIPWILPQTGNTYHFRINALGIMDCSSFFVFYHLPCDPDLLGRTLCIDADVYADTVIASSPAWDHSNLVMSAKCNTVTDSVEFTLKNTGTGNTGSGPQMIVIEDNVISVKNIVPLAPGGLYLYKVKANGATWRATAQQTPANPYSNFTTAAVEGCGLNQLGTVSKGFLTQYPYNPYFAFHYSSCTEVVNSVDPNHKTVSPTGAGPDHIVDSATMLEYTIEFQNTGNDIAYMVRVVDTLAPYLDLATIQPGISSSPYIMELGDNRTLTFTFLNINLPDSGHNQIESNGFVKFKIKQKANNTLGTVINNDAAIYFDYNAPIITNTATVTLGQLLVSGIENLSDIKTILINAYPNPFNTQAVIKVEGGNFDQLQLTVYDITGRIVKQQNGMNTNQFILERNTFNNGSYLFEISSHNKIIGRGKIVAE